MEKEQVVFDKYWFSKHESKLLWLANSWAGKYIFRFKKMGHSLSNKIVKITPNSVGEFVDFKDGKATIKEHFFSRNEYARKLYFALLPMWYTMHTWDMVANLFNQPQLNFGFDSLTVNPGSIGSNNPVDGYVRESTSNQAWADLVDATGNQVKYTGSTEEMIAVACDSINNRYNRVQRSIYLFDTSALTSGATISSAVISFYVVWKNDNFSAAPNMNVYSSNPASTNSLIAADFSTLADTALSTAIAYASLASSYNDFTLNSTGRSNISKTSISKFGARNASYDVANSAPTWQGNGFASVTSYFSNNATNKPKLVVTYTVVAGPANIKSWNALAQASVKSSDGLAMASIKSKNNLA